MNPIGRSDPKDRALPFAHGSEPVNYRVVRVSPASRVSRRRPESRHAIQRVVRNVDVVRVFIDVRDFEESRVNLQRSESLVPRAHQFRPDERFVESSERPLIHSVVRAGRRRRDLKLSAGLRYLRSAPVLPTGSVTRICRVDRVVIEVIDQRPLSEVERVLNRERVRNPRGRRSSSVRPGIFRCRADSGSRLLGGIRRSRRGNARDALKVRITGRRGSGHECRISRGSRDEEIVRRETRSLGGRVRRRRRTDRALSGRHSAPGNPKTDMRGAFRRGSRDSKGGRSPREEDGLSYGRSLRCLSEFEPPGRRGTRRVSIDGEDTDNEICRRDTGRKGDRVSKGVRILSTARTRRNCRSGHERDPSARRFRVP